VFRSAVMHVEKITTESFLLSTYICYGSSLASWWAYNYQMLAEEWLIGSWIAWARIDC